MTCPRKYFYKMMQNWTPREVSPHLLFGGWYATALEHYYKYVTEGKTSDEALEAVVKETLISTWTYRTEPSVEGDINYPHGVNIIKDKDGNRQGYPWVSSDGNKTRENLIRTIIWYVEEFKDDENTPVVILSDGKPAVEYSFRIELAPDIIYCGHLDRLVDYGGDNYIMDQKTTKSTISDYYFKQFNPDQQMSGYTFAGQIIFGIPVKGVIIDAAQIAIGFSRFTRSFTSRTNAQLEEWRLNTIHYLQFAQSCAEKGQDEKNFPMNLESCSNYGGCEYRDVCSKNPGIREQFLKGKFNQDTNMWDPLKQR